MQRLLFTALFFSLSISGFGQIISDFASNADGWTSDGLAPGINYLATGGNPNGFVFAQTPGSFVGGAGVIWVPYYFYAPGKFEGNRSSYYGGNLRFDASQSTTGPNIGYVAAQMTNGGGVSVYFYPTTPFQPPSFGAWATFDIPLSAVSGEWKTTNSATGPAATQTQVIAILTDLSSLQIQGLFRNANMVTRIDNVTMYPPITVSTQPVNRVVCDGQTTTFNTSGTNNPNISYHWQFFNPFSGWIDITNTGGYTNATTAILSVNTTGNFGAGNYRCRISGTGVDDAFSTIATLTINTLPASPTVTGSASCSAGTFTLSANGGAAGQYRWYTVPTFGTAIAGQTNSTYTTPSITTTTNYYVAIYNGTCESIRTMVTATINTPPPAPITTGASSCSPAALTLSASGGSAGQYRWYTASTGGPAISGQNSNSYVTPTLSGTMTYYVAIDNGACESARSPVTATINTPPNAPATTGATGCSSGSITLNASGATNGQYRWYTLATGGPAINGEVNSTFTTPVLTNTTTYFVAINDGACESLRTSVTATVQTCTVNLPPSIAAASVEAIIEGKVTISLTGLVSDPDNNLDLSTLKVIVQPSSGAEAYIDIQRNLILDYAGISFSGKEKLTLEVCDLLGACAQKEIEVDVIGDITVYNGISPNGDNKNDFFFIRYIDVIEATKKNHVFIYNRWGDLLFDVADYDNKTHAFKGFNNNGNEIPSGTYFYKIEFATGKETKTGYLTLKKQ